MKKTVKKAQNGAKKSKYPSLTEKVNIAKKLYKDNPTKVFADAVKRAETNLTDSISKAKTKKTIKKAQTGAKTKKKTSSNVNFRTSEYWGDNYSLDTTGLGKKKHNYYPYTRSVGTKGVLTQREAQEVVDKVKSGKLKKANWNFKNGGKVSNKRKPSMKSGGSAKKK